MGESLKNWLPVVSVGIALASLLGTCQNRLDDRLEGRLAAIEQRLTQQRERLAARGERFAKIERLLQGRDLARQVTAPEPDAGN